MWVTLLRAESRALSAHLSGFLGPVLRPSLVPALHTSGVQHASNDMVPYAGHILDPPTSKQDDRVFLKVMSLTRNICTHLTAVRKTHPCQLSQRGVRLPGCRGIHPSTHPSFLGTPVQIRRFYPFPCFLTSFTNQLIDRRHARIPFLRMDEDLQPSRVPREIGKL